jgi:hypothetical protein
MHKGVFTFLYFCCFLWGTESDASTRRWWSYTKALADDSMQGRDTGSKGYIAAESYILEHFKKAGLSPAGIGGFRQPVPIRFLRPQTASSPIQIPIRQMPNS